MARPKSQKKHDAILAAAVKVISRRGIEAPTAAISHAAGVADGTLFTYFATKDKLLNELYRSIKRELARVIMADFPRQESLRNRLQHVWDRYVQWGVAHPDRQQVLQQIEVWGGLTEESLAFGVAPFAEIESMAETAVAEGVIRDLPHCFLAVIMASLAKATMELTRQHPKEARKLRDAGFEVLWAGIRQPH